VIAYTNPPSFLLYWSDDSETLFYRDEFNLTMQAFYSLVEHFLVKEEDLCKVLMFDLDPNIDLSKV
jgi:hypothetical protein